MIHERKGGGILIRVQSEDTIRGMVLKPQDVSGEGAQQKAPHLRPVTGIRDLAAYSTFGRVLKTVRENAQQTQEEVVESLALYFREQGIPTINGEIYGNLERGKRFPTFAELLPLYQGLVKGCGIQFSTVERELYVLRAREKLAKKKRRIERIHDGQWQQLAEDIALFDDNYSALLLVKQEAESHDVTPTVTPQKQDEYTQPITKKIDTSHILGRDEWVEHMLAFLHTQPAKKMVVVQALTGTGKTTAFKLLERRLGEMSECWALPLYVFKPSIDKTPEDHLDSFLADVTTALKMQAPQTETAKTLPLDERIDDFLNTLMMTRAKGKHPIVLLDDLQVILDDTGELPPCWHQFITNFIEYEPTAILYAATREWPMWLGERTYIEESMLETLPADVCVKLWQNLGFTDVPEDLLRQASNRCDGNAGMIELRAQSLRRPRLVYGWRKSGNVSARDVGKSENQKLIEQLLEEESVFEARVDVKTHEILEQVVGTRLSHRATLLLDVLSVSAVALPFAFLDDVCSEAELAFDELLRCSLVDRDSMIGAGRASLLSFVREACLHKLVKERRVENVEQQIAGIYEAWLRSQDFSTDQEKSAVVSELTVLYIKHQRFLEAAQLFINYGWLCTLFGQIPRLLRVYEERIQGNDWKTNPESEVGVLLLRYQLAQRAGQKIDAQQHNRSYQKIHDYVVAQLVRLHPSTEVHLAHQLMLIPMRAQQFTQAYKVLEDTFERITQSGNIPAEAHASFLYSKARLLARWGEFEEEENGHEEEASRLRNECVDVLAGSVTLWRACQDNALLLQRRYIDFRLARSLNDYAYRERMRGHLGEAESAMRECLLLKKEGAALPKSLATSLSEYSQILAGLGKIREAHSYKDQARQIMDTLKRDDQAGLDADRGMILIECGEIYLLQARIDEAEPLFKEGRDLTRGNPSRQKFYKIANKRLDWIDQLRQSQLRYQLDAHWFEHYTELVAYDDIDWLIHSGPFTAEEQREWDKLFDRREEAAIKARMSELLVQSRQREFALCIEEEREPRLYYPKIPIGEVEARMHGLEALRIEIETEETNAVVRRLYLDSIEEQLSLLRLCASIYARDLEHIQKYNQALYGGPPGVAEMRIALRSLFSMLERARKHPQAASLAEPVLLQLKQWHLYADDFLDENSSEQDDVEQGQDGSSKQAMHEKEEFSPVAVQRFFQDVFHSDFHVTWDVVVEPARENTYVDVNVRILSLPQRTFSIEKIRQLLAEEIEVHAFRSMAGRRSPLALLGSGTAKYGSTEEGLANRYLQQVNLHVYGKPKNNFWFGTLAIGLMAGVISPPLTFRTLCSFLEKVFLVKNMLSGDYESLAAAEAAATREAWKRTSRTVRGITDLTVPGFCSLKDRIYLQGTLDVMRYLNTGDIQQLYVGKIGIGHLEAMKDLHIVSPSLPHLQLALDRDLHERLAAFEGK